MCEVYAVFWDKGEKEKCVDSVISREFSETVTVL